MNGEPVLRVSSWARRCSLVFFALVALAPRSLAGAGPGVVEVDFATPADPPLVKKFGVMNSGIVKMARHQRDLALLKPLRADSLRIDLSIGKRDSGWSREIVAGRSDRLTYYWDEIDALGGMLQRHGVLPYWSFCYMSLPLQSGSCMAPPTNLGKWQEVLREFSRHFREAGIPVGYYEVYNEPDFRNFFTGAMADYLAMYERGVRGLREGDPDAVVGGPALAFHRAWIRPFLDLAAEKRLPTDQRRTPSSSS
jgi:hypothetical protein